MPSTGSGPSTAVGSALSDGPTSVPAELPQSAGAPLVSLIIPTYNSRDLLTQALDAIAAQTLPQDSIEIVVVDDGSTDGTWERLQELSGERPNLTIAHQPNSGRPSVGRNRGLALATGRYVFFHDADDLLAPDALRRLVGFAERHDSDVVVGRTRRVGRPQRDRPFTPPVVDADLVADDVWRSLGPQKLIRRSLIDDSGVRFPEDMVQGEDQVFVARCLFAAHRISVLRDYDYYYRRTRGDGQNVSLQSQSLDNKLRTTTRLAALIVANTAPGPRRDALFRRVIVKTLAPALHRPFLRASPADRRRFLAAIRAEVLPHLTEAMLADVTPDFRRRLLAARDGTVEDLVQLNRDLRQRRRRPLGRFRRSLHRARGQLRRHRM
jgi:glycosyltransferase involved in cell wall biosynthesis